MKIDFHTHGKLAKKLPFSEEYISLLFARAKEEGLDAICLTEHFNTIAYDKMIYFVTDHFPKDGDSYLVNGLRVFLGMEVDVKESGHILVIGQAMDMLTLNKYLEPNKENDFITFEQLMLYLEDKEVIVGLAHPYRQGSHIPEIADELLVKADFIDLNGKDYASKGSSMQEELKGLQEDIHKPILAGSDTHQSFQYGCVYNEFEKEATTICELRQLIEEESYRIEIKEDIDFRVEAAGILKKALKLIEASGGDYVSVLV